MNLVPGTEYLIHFAIGVFWDVGDKTDNKVKRNDKNNLMTKQPFTLMATPVRSGATVISTAAAAGLAASAYLY